MKRWIILPCIALGVCQTAGSGADVRTVHVPTPVPCVDPTDIPPEPPQVGEIAKRNQRRRDAIWRFGVAACLELCPIPGAAQVDEIGL